MKKLLSLVLALCMVCAMALAGAEEASAAVTTDIALSVDGDVVSALLGGGEAMGDTVTSIVSLLNNLSVHAVTEGTKGEGSLNLKDQPLATFAVASGESGVNVLSNLFPTSVLVISGETLQELSATATAGLQDVDAEAIAAAILPKIAAVGEEAMSRVGEPEAVSYTYEGVEMTSYAPLNMTTKEMSLLGLNAIKEILAVPEVAGLTAQLEGFDASQIDQAMEQITNTPDEELPEMKAGIYTNETGSMAFIVDMVKDEEKVNVTVAMLEDGRVNMHMSMPGQADFDFSLNIATGEIAVTMGGDANGLPLTLNLQGQVTDAGFAGTLTISLQGAPVAVLSIQVAEGGELTADYSAEGKTPVDFTNLMGDGDNEAAQGLLMEIMTVGFSNVISAASQAMPEEVNALMALFMSGAEAE